MKVLVTDAENKNALAAIRSLGSQGIRVYGGSARRWSRGFYSRYCAERVRYPSPDDEDAFLQFVVELAAAKELDVLLPIGDATNRLLSKRLASLPDTVAVPVAEWSAMQIASSKALTMSFAERIGVEIPRTYADADEVERFPVVVKQSTGAGGVRYVNTRAELSSMDLSDAVVQDYIPGDGYGFFALFEHGSERMIFMHRRIREYPATGGASTCAVSIYDSQLGEIGLRLLRALSWHGVAMVEFKKDSRDGRYKLMEVNPKFWGSLDLSIAAGADFPFAAIQLALGRRQTAPLTSEAAWPGYRTGVRYQWVFDDLMHVAARPRAARQVLRDLRDPAVEHDVWGSDIRPALFDAAKTCALVVSRSMRGNLRWPHGRFAWQEIGQDSGEPSRHNYDRQWQ